MDNPSTYAIKHPFKGFNKDRGFHSSDIHKAAEELRLEHKGSFDPMYEDPKKNK